MERAQRLRQMVEAALAASANERGRVLAELAGDDPELRAEAAELVRLALDEADASPLPADARGFQEHLESLLQSGLKPELVGEALQSTLERLRSGRDPALRYAFQRELGQGGMGIVKAARDDLLKRDVAIKFLRAQIEGEPSAVDGRLVGRFLDEAQITAQLNHPGVVPIHDVGLDERGRVYFSMQQVEGSGLDQVLDQLREGGSRADQARALGDLLKVCQAVAFAHSRGVVHRDLKPSNVMVGAFGQVYVMDWGLAKTIGSGRRETVAAQFREDGDEALLTREGKAIGSVGYMSPEQAQGERDRIDHRTDIYSLGAILFELLTGAAPHLRHHGERLQTSVYVERVLSGPPALGHIAGQPPELISICERALASAPEDRYPDMSSLATDLQAYLEGRVVSAYETGAWAEARKWVGRNRSLAAALLAVLFVAIGGLGLTGYVQAQGRSTEKELRGRAEDKTREAEAARSLAEQREAEAREQRARAEQSEAVARDETAKVLRLADTKRVQELIDQSFELWPPYPDLILTMDQWLEEADELTSRLHIHRSTISEMRALAEETAPGIWSFEATEDQWQHDTLEALVADLEALETELLAEEHVDPKYGWSVAKRLSFAEQLQSGFAPGGELARAWDAAIPAVRAAYGGLELEPQMGLLPIGPDSASGLWEFAHLPTGKPAVRSAEGQLVLEEETGVVLVLIPGGTFWMGAQPDDPNGQNYDPQAREGEQPVHEVELSPYFLSKYELTQGQWKRLTGTNPSGYGNDARWSLDFLASGVNATLLHPVEQVTWQDCMNWLPRVGLALPTEAQWEYGARAGTETVWWSGAGVASLQGAANLKDVYGGNNSGGSYQLWDEEIDDGSTVHSPVGHYRANGFGLHDVHGNIFELCRDVYSRDFYGMSSREDPLADSPDDIARVSRGGSFYNTASFARSSARRFDTPTITGFSLGTRPARPIAP